jgi:hypothetical protein
VITYEIRHVPLPDLRVVSFETRVLDNGAQAVCGLLENGGDRPSPETPMIERVNGGFFREYIVPALAAGQTTQACIGRSELPAQAHALQFSIDEGRQVAEGDETNNAGAYNVQAVASPATPTPMPSPEPKPTATPTGSYGSKADLTVKAIKIHDHMPDGKDDCAIGRNDVTVVVKNGGQGDASSFDVRLKVDGDDYDATVDSLGAGQEREVAFANVQLKKGQHTLKAVADPDHAVTERKDDNNGLKVNARCTEAAS